MIYGNLMIYGAELNTFTFSWSNFPRPTNVSANASTGLAYDIDYSVFTQFKPTKLMFLILIEQDILRTIDWGW
jgi:hypothetical protein